MVLAPGKMYRPTEISLNSSEPAVYVVEQFNHRISKWNFTSSMFDFTLDPTWGTNGDGTTGQAGPVSSPTDDTLDHPTGIAYDDTNDILIVSDTNHNRLRIIDPADGSFLGSVGQGGRGINDFYKPVGIVYDTIHDILFVADELNHRVKQYDGGNPPTNPEVLDSPTPLPFNRPSSVMFQTADSLFVGDSVTNVLSRYDMDPVVFQEQIGQAGSSGAVDEWFFPGNGQVYNEGTGQVYCTNIRSNQLRNLNGTTVTDQYTNPGRGDGQLYWPEAAIRASAGITYTFVANTRNNRIEVFSNFDTFETNFGSPYA